MSSLKDTNKQKKLLRIFVKKIFINHYRGYINYFAANFLNFYITLLFFYIILYYIIPIFKTHALIKFFLFNLYI